MNWWPWETKSRLKVIQIQLHSLRPASVWNSMPDKCFTPALHCIETISDIVNERKEFMQKTHHTQQTDTRTAKNQVNETRRHKETNKHLLRERLEYRLGTASDKCHWGLEPGL